MTQRSYGIALALGGVCLGPAFADPLKYPETRREDRVDTIHGTTVQDPYRWLEDDVRKNPEVQAWVDAQNKVTGAFLEGIPQRKGIEKRITDLWNYERYTAPSKVGGRYFFRKNDGLQNQSVLYVMDKLDGEPRVLIDPNGWSKDGTVALAQTSVSQDGRYLAYAQSEAGSDWETWKVLNVDTGKPLADEVKWVKFSSASWTADNKGFFYSRYDEPKPGEKFQSVNLNQKVFYHRIGTPQADDVLVYKRPDQPDWGFQAAATDDGRYLVITTWQGTDDRYRITYRDLSEPLAMPVDLIDNFDNDYTFIDNDGPLFYFRTDLKAPNSRVIAIDVRKPGKEHWKEIIPEAKEKLEAASLVGNLLVVSYLKDAHTQVKMFSPEGAFVRELELPGIGTASGFGGRRIDTETFYLFSSYATPPSIYRYDLVAGKATLIRSAKVKFNPEDYDVRQVFAKSKDGTKVPIFITMKKGTKLDGSNPTLLYGYGGFNIPLTPAFSVSIAAWLDMGGIYAVANLRGGGEYGKEWHKAGTKERKQNVFDDFIAAAEYLVKEKFTSTEKLAIKGGSNGGLLIGAVMTQRPDLFGACVPHVGVMDMLRFHKFTAGRFWVDDYGSPDEAKDFPALFKYSPYHNLKPGVKYPPTMVITADTDDRVVPGHSFKFAAQLQYCQAGDAPVLARIETRAGHGAGKPTTKLIEELADEYAFLMKTLKMEVK
ncbi:MAG TPA: prolyl oligopeptidase family serine peptidase [Gemmataceae bacterium]|nr:prolyl oligopeptidase family serine peptidase [Gemmataceae bacterium]